MRRCHLWTSMWESSSRSRLQASIFWPPINLRPLAYGLRVCGHSPPLQWHPRSTPPFKTWQTFFLSGRKHHKLKAWLVGLAAGTLRHSVEGSPQTVAPWRWGSTTISRTCEFWWVLYRKHHPHESGLRLRFYETTKKIRCHSAAQLSMVIPLPGARSITAPQLHCTLAHNLAIAEVMLTLNWCGPLLVSDMILNFCSCSYCNAPIVKMMGVIQDHVEGF
jgi:hypothetical protein